MMSVQNVRLFLLAALIAVGMLLYNNWQKTEGSAANPIKQNVTTQNSAASSTSTASEIPGASTAQVSNGTQAQTKAAVPGKEANEIPEPAKETLATGKNVKETAESTAKQKPGAEAAAQNKAITVKTDVFNITIDTEGGDIIYASLPAYAEGEHEDPKLHPYILLDESQKRYYIAQTGLTGEDGPDRRGVGRAKYTSTTTDYQLEPGQDRLVVELKTDAVNGVDITKRYTFHRGSYVVELEYLIDNHSEKDYSGSLYGRLKRRPDQSSGIGFLGVQTYTGAAIYTPSNHYKKISFKDIEEKPFTEEIEGGWAAMVEHYFISALIPEPAIRYNYQTTRLSDGTDAIGFVAPATTVAPGASDSVKTRLYAGPQVTEVLGKLGTGLELSVDYGILWPICQPLFWLLKQIYNVVGNWGWAIVIITIIIKLLFYKLSSSSYRSMGNMRKLQPRIEALKERYGDDKQKFSQAVMELYKKEKVNPLGGCLPIVIQIPVFIALYYVLLGSVELRQAPFILWIQDLSVKDPYYVLPILMGLSMLLQQKLNPPPPDPIQAKVMMLMPVIFTVLFLNFPSGLVLYWFVNNVLSIAQQWFIMRNMNGSTSHGTKPIPSKA